MPPQGLFPVLVCSRDGIIDVHLATCLFMTGQKINRNFWMVTAEGAGTAIGRNELSKKAAMGRKGIAIRCLMVDDDIRMEPDGDAREANVNKLAEAILEADRHGWNFVVPYRLNKRGNVDGVRWDIMSWEEPKNPLDPNDRSFSDYKIDKMKDFDIIDGYAGLGFYYGILPLDYIFKEGPNNVGEDALFFLENKIEIRLVKIPLKHHKSRWI